MPGKIGRFQVQGFTGWSPKISKANHISSIYGLSPNLATDIWVELLSTKYGKCLDTLLSKYPTKYFDTDDEYTWEVGGTSRRNIPLVEVRDEFGVTVEPTTADPNPMIGAGFAPFYLVFSEAWFYLQEVIFGPYNNVYPMQVLDEGKLEGTNVVYKVVAYGGALSKGIPYNAVAPGSRFSAEFAPISKGLSRNVGGVRFAVPTTMRNEFSQIRIHHKVSGDLMNKKMAIKIPLIQGGDEGTIRDGSSTVWMHYVEMEAERQFREYKNNIMWWGTSTRDSNGEYHNFDQSGEVLREGAGLEEQMSYGNRIYYSDFSLDLIENALYELSASKIPMDERKFVLRTGRCESNLALLPVSC